MTIITKEFIAILPILILAITIISIMIQISLYRNHYISFVLTILGINFSLLSLWLVLKICPIKINYFICLDNFSIFYTTLILISSLFITMLSYNWLLRYLKNKEEFYILILIATIGSIVLSCSNNLIFLLLGIELISLPLFGMIGYNFSQINSLKTSIKYTILSMVSSSFLLFGMALIYAKSGSLSFVDINNYIVNNNLINTTFLIGLIMIISGLSFKLSLFPFHLWTVDTYHGSPIIVSAFIATISKLAVISTMIRFFAIVSVTNIVLLKSVLYLIALSSIIFGNIMAINQNNIKKILGYSSISHTGYLLVALIQIQSQSLSLEAIGIYLIGYIFSNLIIFGVISIISNFYENYGSLSCYKGLFWKYPLLSVSLTIALLSLAGIPLTLGFIGKFYIIMIGISNNLTWITGSMIISSSIGIYFYLKIIINLYLSSEKNLIFNYNQIWVYNIPIVILSIIIILLGIYPQSLISLVQSFQYIY